MNWLKHPLFKVPIKYGVIGSVLGMVVFVVLVSRGTNPLITSILFDYRLLLFPLFIFFATKEFRDYANDRKLHYWQGMTLGLVVYGSMAILMSTFLIAYGRWFNTSFLQDYIDTSISRMEGMNSKLVEAIGEDRIKQTIELLPLTTLNDLALDYLLKSVVIGLFFTILISLILRKT